MQSALHAVVFTRMVRTIWKILMFHKSMEILEKKLSGNNGPIYLNVKNTHTWYLRTSYDTAVQDTE